MTTNTKVDERARVRMQNGQGKETGESRQTLRAAMASGATAAAAAAAAAAARSIADGAAYAGNTRGSADSRREAALPPPREADAAAEPTWACAPSTIACRPVRTSATASSAEPVPP